MASEVQTGNKLNELQKDVDETAELMRDNIKKVVERGDKLDDLQEKSDYLEANTQIFKKKVAAKVTFKYYWRNTKIKLCIAGTIIAVILVIILIILLVIKPWESSGSDGNSDTASTTTTSPTPLSVTTTM